MHWDHADCTCASPYQTSLDGGVELEAGCKGVRTIPPPPPPDLRRPCGFLKQLVFCKKAPWVSYRIRRAPPPMKNPGSAPVRWSETRRGYSLTRIASSDYGYHVTWITNLTPKHDLAFLLLGWEKNWEWSLFTWSPIALLCWWLTVSFDEC